MFFFSPACILKLSIKGGFPVDHFQQSFPRVAAYLRNQQLSQHESGLSRLHWLLLGVFSLLTVSGFSTQLFCLFLLIGAAALIKGPAMLLYGAVYSFLIGLFPPLGIVLSLLFFLLSIRQITRNWRFGLVASFFYLYPFALTAFKFFTDWDSFWVVTLLAGVGIFTSHFLLTQLYHRYGASRSVAWSLLLVPYDCLVFFIPKKAKKIPVSKGPRNRTFK